MLSGDVKFEPLEVNIQIVQDGSVFEINIQIVQDGSVQDLLANQLRHGMDNQVRRITLNRHSCP